MENYFQSIKSVPYFIIPFGIYVALGGRKGRGSLNNCKYKSYSNFFPQICEVLTLYTQKELDIFAWLVPNRDDLAWSKKYPDSQYGKSLFALRAEATFIIWIDTHRSKGVVVIVDILLQGF